jgi:nucleotidyltransferase substrate binding protein (TIGR01987 family)
MHHPSWKDYFDALGRSIQRLEEVIKHPDINKNDYMRDASIQRFEFVIELFWKALKKILAYEKLEATTPRDVLNKAFQFSLIDDEDIWLKMLDDRNSMSHMYSLEDAAKVFENIKKYLPIIVRTYEKLRVKYSFGIIP